ncbi:MAG TPA: hypothetical protein VJW23_11455 [Propionibacteriaceae bacterium]|nr:hypothetical protein [Propionibacteriaceae bacterium]
MKRRCRITITITDSNTQALLGSVSIDNNIEDDLLTAPPGPLLDRAQSRYQEGMTALAMTAYLDAFGGQRVPRQR